MTDYRDFEGGGRSNSKVNPFWWKGDGKTIHEDVISITDYIEEDQSLRKERLLRNLRLYGNLKYLGIRMQDYSRTEDQLRTQNRLTLNIIKNMVDTVTNRIAKNKPLPTFLTDGGDYNQQQKAKKLQKFMKGVFFQHSLYELGQRIFRDASIFDTGVLKIHRNKDQFIFDRILSSEILVDEMEAFYNNPRSCFQIRHYAKEVAADLWPDYAEEIMTMASEEDGDYRRRRVGESVKVIEGWHLPSGKEATDGRHVIVMEGQTLLDEEYKRSRLPFVFLHWSDPIVGVWGGSLADELVGIQMEINKILRTIQKAMHLLSIPKVFIEHGSKVVKQHFNNEIGGIITYTGKKPDVEAFNAVSPELFSHLDRLYARAFEIAGVSQLSAQSLKPSGLDSGKALRTFNDIETERFVLRGQAYENFFIDIAEHIIELSKEISEEYKDFGVMAVGKKSVEEIKWKDVDIDRDKFSMKIFPTSALSETPSARLQEVQEMLQAGFIDKDTGIQLLEFPDLENAYNSLTAAQEDIDLVVEELMSKGKFIAPDPLMNLELGIRRMNSAYLRSKTQKMSEERLELMRRWIQQAQALLVRAQSAVQPQALPNAVPQAAPQSNLLPVNTPANQALVGQA